MTTRSILDAALDRARLGAQEAPPSAPAGPAGRPTSVTALGPVADPYAAKRQGDEPLAILSELLGSPRWEEILGTLRELARNGGGLGHSGDGEASETVELGDLRIEKHAHRVLVGGSEVALTGLEFRLLVALVERRDRVQSRGVLLNDVWELPASSRTRTVDTHVRRLRDKLGATGEFIHTVRGVGYRFSVRPSIRHADGRCKTIGHPSSHREVSSHAGSERLAVQSARARQH